MTVQLSYAEGEGNNISKFECYCSADGWVIVTRHYKHKRVVPRRCKYCGLSFQKIREIQWTE